MEFWRFIGSEHQLGVELSGSYDPILVALSLGVAILAAYTALAMIDRIIHTHSTARNSWLAVGAAVMGGGIWSVHFIAMLAFSLPTAIEYSLTITLLSIMPAILGSGFALYFMSKPDNNRLNLQIGALLMAVGIGTMHYTGMEAMRMNAAMRYDFLLFAASILAAYLLALLAFQVRFLIHYWPKQHRLAKLSAALMMGCAVGGMHYTAMAAVRFFPTTKTEPYLLVMPPLEMGLTIGSITILIIGVAIIGTMIDHRLSEASASVQKSEAFSRLLLASVGEGIFGVDVQGRTTFVNPAAAYMLSDRVENLTNRVMHDLLHNKCNKEDETDKTDKTDKTGQNIVCPMLQSFTEGVSHRVDDDQFYRHDGSQFPVSYTCTPIMNRGGRVGTVVTFRNTSKRKVAELALLRAWEAAEQANRSKSLFLANMSHEIRTPMNAILGMGEVLKNSGLNQKQSENLKVLTHAGENLLSLINDILDLSKIEAGQLHMEAFPFDLQALTEGTYHILLQTADNKGIKFNLRIHPYLPDRVIGDAQRLRQILLNLLNNAIKFTEQGHVTLTVEPEQKDLIRFIVSDSGTGIPPEQLHAIFNPFVQVKLPVSRRFGGTGLGLSICQQLVKAMGGEIQVSSKVGFGSTFYFIARLPTLVSMHDDEPYRQESPSTTLDFSPLKPSQTPTINLLLVDDADDNRMVIKAFLDNTPHTITEAIDGAEAVKIFQSTPYDLVLMDIQMPILDGFAATQQIRAWEQTHDMPATAIVALTANAMREDIEKAMRAGCNMHVTKPISRNQLMEIIDAVATTDHPIKGTADFLQLADDLQPTDDLQNGPQTWTISNTHDPSLGNVASLNLTILNTLYRGLAGNIAPIKQFIQNLPQRLADLSKAISEQNPEQLGISAHKLKGTARTFGAERLAMLSLQLEEIGKRGSLPEDETLFNALKDETNMVATKLSEYLHQLK